MLTFRQLRVKNRSRCQRWHQGQDWTLSDWGVALAGECGEALNIIKKLNRERDGIVGNVHDYEHLREELAAEIADTLLYLDLLADAADIDLEAAVVKKFNEVSRRNNFPERLLVDEDT